MYRILASSDEVRERRAQLTHPPYARPELLAEKPNELHSWDITKLKGPAKWTSYYLYVILDVFSRYAVGWTVQHREDSHVAKALIAQVCDQQQIQSGQLTVHADRGSSMTSKPVAFLLADLGVTKTHTGRTHPATTRTQRRSSKRSSTGPDSRPVCSIEHARAFCRRFFDYYNNHHRHCGIELMTPATVHHGHAQETHAARSHVLDAAYQATPERFVHRPPRPPALPTAAWINKPNNEEAQA